MSEPIDAAALYQRAPVGLATIRRNGEFIASNESLRDALGATTAGRAARFTELLRKGDRIYWETHVGPLLDMQGQVREIAVEIGTDTGPLPVLLNAKLTTPGEPDSSIDLVVFTARDRRSYEAELMNARNRAQHSETRARLLAETLQQSLIPPLVPDIPGFEIGAAYRPAGTGSDVGGDFYDFFRVTPTDWCVAVGDVCGKGAAAAALTGLVRFAVRGAAVETADLAEALGTVNSVLLLEGKRDMCTGLLVRLTSTDAGSNVRLASAGHPLPRLVTSGGELHPVGRSGTLLGAIRTPQHPLDEFELEAGDSLVLYTDGVTEARRDGEFFGDRQLDKLIAEARELSPHEMAEDLAQAAIDFQDGEPHDDVAVVVVRAKPHR